MNILYIGDIMGEAGIETVEKVLPVITKAESVGLVIAQSENVSDGRSMLTQDMERLQKAGVDFFTGGNHTPKRSELHKLLEDENMPVIGPANMHSCPGKGWKYFTKYGQRFLIISLLGDTFSTTHPPIEKDNVWQSIDNILQENKDQPRDATIVNFHGDFSSEKRGIGFYLDGRVSAVIGDHWHVPTADASVLPLGTAHITDVGMCGAINSSLGVKLESVFPRWRDGIQTKNTLETSGPRQFNAVVITIDPATNRAASVKSIQRTL